MNIKTYYGYLAYTLDKKLGQIVWAIALDLDCAIASVAKQTQVCADFVYTQDKQNYYAVESIENGYRFLELFDQDNNPVFDTYSLAN